jgi:hypothetical protein
MHRLAPSETLTFRDLGRNGRLGNQLFQIAGTLGIALARGTTARFPRSWAYRSFFSLPPSLFAGRLTIARCDDSQQHVKHLDESSRPYLQDVSLWGEARGRIWRWLQPSGLAAETARRQLGDVLDRARKLAVHVRRGDYVESGITVPAAFYLEAVEDVRAAHPECHVLVFSDDLDWCRRELAALDATFVEGNPDWLDLTLMTMCDHHVCANSTFSWWGAFLSNDASPVLPWIPGTEPTVPRLVFDGWRIVELTP